jgi:hypothetical protein
MFEIEVFYCTLNEPNRNCELLTLIVHYNLMSYIFEVKRGLLDTSLRIFGVGGHVYRHRVEVEYIALLMNMEFISRVRQDFYHFQECKARVKSCLTSEINSIFNYKALNFLFITFSLLLEHVYFKSDRF